MTIKKTKEFSPKANWIWDDSDRLGRQYYLRAKRTFSLSAQQVETAITSGQSQLLITAEANYQVWLNRTLIGHGPAKAPENQRYIDSYDISDQLVEGENVLEILVGSIGNGTMNYCLGEAGLLFQLELPGQIISSDQKTLVQRDPQRTKATVRRWAMPYIEDIDGNQSSADWQPARTVEKEVSILPRPVPHPQRHPLSPKRIISTDAVKLPNFSCSFRIKPYIVPADQERRWNVYKTSAFVVVDLISSHDQEITLVPSGGEIDWYFDNRLIVASKAWSLWNPAKQKPTLRLKKGANRLIGGLLPSHFEEIHLAAFVPHPIKVKNPFGAGGFQIISAGPESMADLTGFFVAAAEGSSKDSRSSSEGGPLRQYEEWVNLGNFPKMSPADTMLTANAQDIAVNARPIEGAAPEIDTLQFDGHWRFPGQPKGQATRIILDLGAVNNGWLSFKAFGQTGGKFIFSFFEALEFGPPVQINWPEACNNALTYRLRDGWQDFESFFAYGVRYVVVYYEGPRAAALKDLRIFTANCGGLARGAFLSDNIGLNAIYAMCEQTLISATDDTLTDCPTYEAVNWNFDNRLGTMADLATFRNISILKNTIEQYAHDPYYPGLVRSHYPSAWENRIPVFSFHWIILCEEFHRHTGDDQFLQNVFGQVASGLAEGLAMIDSSGLLIWPAAENPWHIIDWNMNRDDDGHPIVSAEQGMFLGTLAAGEYLAKASGLKEANKLAQQWKKARLKLLETIHRKLWRADLDAYADSIHADGKLSDVTSQASNSILATYGLGSPAWRKRLAKRISEKDPAMLASTSPMGMFYVLEFLDQCEAQEAIFQIILEEWLPMVKAGDATAWEHFPQFANLRWPTRSRCHPFAAYILKYYAKYVMGARLSGKNMSEVTFRPQPPKGVTECRGVIPTAHGVIRTGWKRNGTRITSSIEIPQGITLKKSV